MDYTKELLLDVNAVDNYKFVQAKQGDRVLRVLNISLLKDGTSYSPDAAHVWFRCQKPDGHAVIITDTDTSNPITKTGDKYSVPLNAQCLVVAGRALCDLALLDASNNILSTVTFVLDIIPMPDVTDEIVSSDSFQRLLDAIEAAETLSEQIEAKIPKSAQATKTSGMTQAVGIDSNGKLWTDPGGGSGGGAVDSVNGMTGDVVLDAEDVGALPDDTVIPTKTSDLTNDSGFLTEHQSLAAYRTSAAQDTIDAGKVDKISGKGLSTNDYTTAEKNKLAGIATGAEVNVQSDWNQTNTAADDYIKNKPTIPTVPTNVSAFANDAGYLTQHQSLSAYRTSSAQDIIDAGKENSSNKVTALSASSTDTEYPSAKCVYDIAGDVESLLEALL